METKIKDELLINLYKIYSKSNNETPMIEFLCKELSKKEIYGELLIENDKSGNLYITKGTTKTTYPCAVAHMDQVQSKSITDVFICNNQYFGWDFNSKSQEGLGADDKNGIWCVLKLLQEFTCMKAAFFVQEEIGCIGSSNSDISFFEDVKYILQADRKGSSDMIFNACGIDIASKQFIDDVTAIGEKYKYKSTKGSSTDVKALVTNNVGVSCMNISCGYYNPHTTTEYTLYNELVNCFNFMKDIFTKLTDVYTFEYIKPVYNNWNYSGKNNSIYFNQASYNPPSSGYDNSTYIDSYNISKLKELKQLLKIINTEFKTLDNINIQKLYLKYNSKFPKLTLSDYMSLILFSCFGVAENNIC